jgi:hypothetical protein
MSFSFNINYLRCPLTNLFFNEPVVCSDGYSYERIAIEDYIKTGLISPMTNESISSEFTPNLQLKEFVDHMLTLYPELRHDKFMNKKPYHLFQQEFTNCILVNKFEDLTVYTNILINNKLWDDAESETICEYIFKNCKNYETIMKILNNSIDYDSEDEYGRRPIHLACQYSSDKIISFLLSKGANGDCEDGNGNKPIHYISKHQHHGNNVIELFIEKHNDTFDQDGLLPIHLTCKNIKSWDSLEPFIRGNYDLEVYSKEGFTPLHYLCIYCDNKDIIKQFMNLNINISVTTQDEYRNTCFELLCSNPNLDKETVHELIYYFLDKMYKKITINPSYLE